VELINVCVHRNTVVVDGTVKFLEEKMIVPMGIIERARKKHLQAIIELLAVANAALVRAVTGDLARHGHSG
jgi:hypothetical protein